MRFGELEELGLEPATFDVVSAIEVLEHVPNPRGLVATIQSLLRPGGVFYATTPHGRGISVRVLGTRWSIVSPPEHLQLFSTAGMRSLMRSVGLEVLRLRTQAVNPHELIAALRRKGAPRDRNVDAYQLNEALSTRKSGRVVKATANGALALTHLGDSLKLTARR